MKRLARWAAVLTLVASVVAAPAVASASPGTAEPPGSNAGTGVTPSRAAGPGIAPPGLAKTAVFLDSNGQPIPQISDEVTAQWGCTPVSGRDNPHRSATGVAVSGHGWWGKGSCSNSRADVLNCLYEWYTDNTWRQKTCSEVEELSPGTGGSAERTNARRNCDSTAKTSWRNHVNVDVIGEVDSNEVPYNQADVYCRIY